MNGERRALDMGKDMVLLDDDDFQYWRIKLMC